MNWLVKWYWFDSIGENDAIVRSKILKLCETYEEAYKIMVALVRGPSYGWFRVEEN